MSAVLNFQCAKYDYSSCRGIFLVYTNNLVSFVTKLVIVGIRCVYDSLHSDDSAQWDVVGLIFHDKIP